MGPRTEACQEEEAGSQDLEGMAEAVVQAEHHMAKELREEEEVH